jgi:two-component system cell cycle response regulator
MTDNSTTFLSATATPASLKPRVLIADDSRIVRATLVKHIQGMFDFCEALDGEEAWEILQRDASIRVLITDLTMPRLDGYGLLARIRSSEIPRVRSMPVVVVSGSDDRAEREKAKKAGATDLITKGIGTAQLLSRLDILARLVNTQREYEESLAQLVEQGSAALASRLQSPFDFRAQAESMLTYATRHQRNAVLLSMCLGGIDSAGPNVAAVPASLVNAIGQLLRGTIRGSDAVARTGNAEFTLATANIDLESARGFANRLCRAIAASGLAKAGQEGIVASCGVASLCEYRVEGANQAPTLNALWELAARRGALGRMRAHSGVVGPEEEALLLQGSPGQVR